MPRISQLGRRLAWRLWPGPATLIFARAMADGLYRRLPDEVRALISPSGDVALRSPSHPIVRDVLRLLPAPLVIAMVATPQHPIPTTAEPLRGLAGVNMVIDAGPTQYQQFATVVKVEDERWSIERPGVIDSATLMQTASLIILFVCTGNTCRSPMAEAICKVVLARRLRLPGRPARTARVRDPIGRRGRDQRRPGGRPRHRRRPGPGRLAGEPPQPQDRRQPRPPGRLHLRHDRRPPRRAARRPSPRSNTARSCSTPPAATSPTPSGWITKPTAEPPRSSRPCSNSGSMR